MNARIFYTLLLFLSSGQTARANATQVVEEMITEAHPIVFAIDHDDSAKVEEWLKQGHTPLAKIQKKFPEELVERAATHGALKSFEIIFRAIHAIHKDELIRDSRGTPLIVNLCALAVPGKESTKAFEYMISLMLTVSPEMTFDKDHAYIGDGRTPLHQAAAVGNLNVIQYLIARGAPVNAKNSIGETPLHLAARYGHIEAVQYLVKSGAPINEKTKYTQTTPLMAAAEMGHENIIRMLMISGAERDIQDAFGKTAPDRFYEYRALYANTSTRRSLTKTKLNN